MPRIIDTSKANPAILDTMGRLALYSGMDNLTLFEIADGINELMDERQREVYNFEMELQAALLEMSLNGTPVDVPARNKLVQQLEKEQKYLTDLLNEMLEAIGYFDYYLNMAVEKFAHKAGLPSESLPRSWEEWLGRPINWRRSVKLCAPRDLPDYHKALKIELFNPNSSTQKLQLFYHFFGQPDNSVAASYFFSPPWLKKYGIREFKGRKQDGSFGPTADRDALERIIRESHKGEGYAALLAAPFAKICLDAADIVKSLGFLRCKLENGYFRASFGALTDTGRLASRQNAMGYGSNAQNVTPKLRHILSCPQGMKLAAPDYEQIESRNVGAICYVRLGSSAYLDASECGDLHTLVCSMVWPGMPWPKDFDVAWISKHGPFPKDLITAAKKVAGAQFYRHFSYRETVKRLGHGSNYLGKPPHMAIQTHIPLKLVSYFQDGYFEVFPEIPTWHSWVAETIQTEGEITTLFGRTRQFFDRPNDDATIRKAVAYEPQSMAADYTNRALLRIMKAHMYEDLPVELFLQKHDEIGFRFELAHEVEVCEKVKLLMEEHYEFTDPDGNKRVWYVPTEFSSGWNLGYSNEQNPNGLDKIDPARVRKSNNNWKEWTF